MLRESLRLIGRSFRENRANYVSLIAVVILEIASIYGLFLLNGVYGSLYDAVYKYDIDVIWSSIWTFSLIAGALVLVDGYSGFYMNRLSFHIRQGLVYYYISTGVAREAAGLQIENKGQRLQEDLRQFGERITELGVAVFRSLIKLPLFLGVILTLTRWWVALTILATVILGTILTRVVASRLIPMQAHQENNEANLRKYYDSSSVSAQSFLQFREIGRYFLTEINPYIKYVSLTQSALVQTFALLPFILLMPMYISKVITVGAFMQAVNALGKVIASLSVLIDNRQLIAGLGTTLLRIRSLEGDTDV